MADKIRVAAVQLHTQPAQVQANLDHALPLVERAAAAGAMLVVLPELAASGYSLSRLLWDAAETRSGPTVQWLSATSRRLGVYLGTGLVEAAGADFYDTYALAGPDGDVLGYVRKTMAETGLFRSEHGRHVIDTPFGRVGIGICADNHFVPMVRLMQRESPDLMLMPHAWPGAWRTGGLVNQRDVTDTNAKARGLAGLYAGLLGVPAIFANHSGPLGSEDWSGLLGRLMPPDQFRFLGQSTIVDSDGATLAQLDSEVEDVLVAEIHLTAARKIRAQPTVYGSYGGGFLHPSTSNNLARDALLYLDSTYGRLSYLWSRDRRKRAGRVSSRS
jgi:N-carbamoylputrescine amidase